MSGGDWGAIKIQVANSFPVKDILKKAEYSYDSLSKTWSVLFDSDEDTLKQELKTLKDAGVAIHSGSMSPRETQHLWNGTKEA